jgi:glycosyltransferase involved in cell wall biosynthesis
MKQNDHMHVVHIITKLEMGGAQKVCLALKRGLDAEGVWTGLISGKDGTLCKQASSLPNTILIQEMTREVTWRNFFSETRCFIRLTRTLKKIRKIYPDLIVHTHSTKAGLIGRWAGFFAGSKKRIHTIHGFGFHDHQNPCIHFFIYLLELVTSFITTHYICVSTTDAKRGIAIFPRFAQKHTVIRAAVDSNHFIKAKQSHIARNLDESQFIFGTSGVFRKGKNHIELFQAFEQVHQKHPRAKLELLGDGILRPYYEQWIKEHNLENAIILHGWQQDVTPIMSKWNAFVFSSLWEGMPCSIVEARLLALPVITYDTGGVRDVVIQGKNGYIYKQHDWQGLAAGMNAIIENHTIYDQLKNFPDNLLDFTLNHMIQQHIELYRSL